MMKVYLQGSITVDNFPTLHLFVTNLDGICPMLAFMIFWGQRSHKLIKGHMWRCTCKTLQRLIIFGNPKSVCNQTWLVDALCWPPSYSGVKGHISRSKVKWGQMWRFTCKTLERLITFQPCIWLWPNLVGRCPILASMRMRASGRGYITAIALYEISYLTILGKVRRTPVV